MTAVNTTMVKDAPYIDELRGGEGVDCSRIIARHGPALLSEVVAREYDTRKDDRLSSPKGFAASMPLLAKVHGLMLKEFGRQMSWRRRLRYCIGIIGYTLVGQLYRLVRASR